METVIKTETNTHIFRTTYLEELTRISTAEPTRYERALRNRTLDQLTDAVMAAIKAKAFDKDGPAIQATLKRLGIKNTYGAIHVYLKAN